MCQRHLSSQRSPGRNKTENLVVIYLSKGSTSCLQAQNHWNKNTTSKRILRSKSSGSSTQLPCVKNTQGLQVETPSGFRRAQWILWFINTPGISFPSLLPWLSGVSKAGLFPWIYFSWPLSPLLSSSTFVCSTESSARCSTRSASNSEKKNPFLEKKIFLLKKKIFFIEKTSFYCQQSLSCFLQARKARLRKGAAPGEGFCVFSVSPCSPAPPALQAKPCQHQQLLPPQSGQTWGIIPQQINYRANEAELTLTALWSLQRNIPNILPNAIPVCSHGSRAQPFHRAQKHRGHFPSSSRNKGDISALMTPEINLIYPLKHWQALTSHFTGQRECWDIPCATNRKIWGGNPSRECQNTAGFNGKLGLSSSSSPTQRDFAHLVPAPTV